MTEQRFQLYRQLGLTIAYYRKLNGLTQLQLSEKIHKSRTFISNLEAINMSAKPSLDTLIDIADAFDIPVSRLFQFPDE